MSKKKSTRKAEPVFLPFLIISLKSSTSGIKVSILGSENGKDLLDEIHQSVSRKRMYFNKQHGILFTADDFSHAYLTQEKIGD